jgi:hypothetical protein
MSLVTQTWYPHNSVPCSTCFPTQQIEAAPFPKRRKTSSTQHGIRSQKTVFLNHVMLLWRAIYKRYQNMFLETMSKTLERFGTVSIWATARPECISWVQVWCLDTDTLGYINRCRICKVVTGQVGFVVDKVVLWQFFSEYFGFPYQSSFHQLLHNHPHLSFGAGTLGQ